MSEEYQYELNIFASINACNLGIFMPEKEKMDLIAEMRLADPDLQWALEPDGSCRRETKRDIPTSVIQFSKEYPDLLFDLWITEWAGSTDNRSYIQNGRVQDVSPEITWPIANASKMREP